MSWRVGIDIGGTFTDIAVVAEDGGVTLWKEDSTHPHPEIGVQRGLAAVAANAGLALEEFLDRTTLLVHGSTIATNIVIERDGPQVGLLCTEGFRDVLLFRDGFKWERFNDRLPRPRDFADRSRRLGVRERVAPDGTVLEPLDEQSARDAVRELGRRGAEAIAVSLLWSNANPAHERRIRELVAEELPDVPVILASDVLPEIGEWVRTSAAVLSAYVYPRSARYLRELKTWLREHGLRRDVLIMQVNGGCATVERTLKVPAGILISGPAAAPAAARHIGERVDAQDMITVDMGGTSFDVCLMRAGEAPLSRTIQLEHQPIGVQAVEVHSIGAGGGSIAWIDSGGALRVGPESAGARPGPAAYGQGGERPTVTDANVVLGYLSPEAFLGGRRTLDAARARRALEQHVGEPLGIEALAAAAGVIELVNASMVDAIRVVSVQRGIDPRPFLLVAGGGAGPLHAGRLAAELGIERVLVPAEAGTICSFGMTVTDVRHDYAAMVHTSSADPALGEVRAAFAELEQRARDDLAASGFGPETIALERSVDARYEGQVHDLTIAVPPGELDDAALAAVQRAFHAAHAERYTWSIEEHAVEFLHWRVTGVGLMERPATVRLAELEPRPADAARAGSRQAFFAELGGLVETPVYDRARFEDGATLSGPALIDSATTTVVVNPGQTLIADARGSLLIDSAPALAGAVADAVPDGAGAIA